MAAANEQHLADMATAYSVSSAAGTQRRPSAMEVEDQLAAAATLHSLQQQSAEQHAAELFRAEPVSEQLAVEHVTAERQAAIALRAELAALQLELNEARKAVRAQVAPEQHAAAQASEPASLVALAEAEGAEPEAAVAAQHAEALQQQLALAEARGTEAEAAAAAQHAVITLRQQPAVHPVPASHFAEPGFAALEQGAPVEQQTPAEHAATGQAAAAVHAATEQAATSVHAAAEQAAAELLREAPRQVADPNEDALARQVDAGTMATVEAATGFPQSASEHVPAEQQHELGHAAHGVQPGMAAAIVKAAEEAAFAAAATQPDRMQLAMQQIAIPKALQPATGAPAEPAASTATMPSQTRIRCPICLGSLFAEPADALTCGHLFHRECLQTSMDMAGVELENLRCPVCRRTARDVERLVPGLLPPPPPKLHPTGPTGSAAEAKPKPGRGRKSSAVAAKQTLEVMPKVSLHQQPCPPPVRNSEPERPCPPPAQSPEPLSAVLQLIADAEDSAPVTGGSSGSGLFRPSIAGTPLQLVPQLHHAAPPKPAGPSPTFDQDDESRNRSEWQAFYRRVKAKAPPEVVKAWADATRAKKKQMFAAWRSSGGTEWGMGIASEVSTDKRSTVGATTRGLMSRDMMLHQYNGNVALVDRIIAAKEAAGDFTRHPDLEDERLYYVWVGSSNTSSREQSHSHSTTFTAELEANEATEALVQSLQQEWGTHVQILTRTFASIGVLLQHVRC